MHRGRRRPPRPPLLRRRYAVRMAVLDLERPPRWFQDGQAKDHMTADEARAFASTQGADAARAPPLSRPLGPWCVGLPPLPARLRPVCTTARCWCSGTCRHAGAPHNQRWDPPCSALPPSIPIPPPPWTGPVRLLTDPQAAGYLQNPISVYYCYSPDGAVLQRCIAEVRESPFDRGAGVGWAAVCAPRHRHMYAWVQERGEGEGGGACMRVRVCAHVLVCARACVHAACVRGAGVQGEA